MECDNHVIIDPSTVSLSKTRFPDGGEVKQFSANETKGRAGQWYIVLSVQSSKNKRKFERKSPIGSTSEGGGFYKTEAAAARDVHVHRMMIEGFKRRGGSWYGSPPIAYPSPPCTGLLPVADVVMPDASAQPLLPGGPLVPLGRPEANTKRKAIDLVDEDAEAAAEAKDEKYRKLAARAAPKKKGWGHRTIKFIKNLSRSKDAHAADILKRDKSRRHRQIVRDHLLDALDDPSGAKLEGLLVDPDHDQDLSGDMFVSTFQLHRVRRQATALFNYYDILDDYHPEHDVLWCANKAAQRLGHVVTGRTVYRWHLEFRNVSGFLVDKRGSYTRSVFVEDEDVKLKAKAWMKDPVNHKHLSRDKFAAWVNKTLIREVITNHATSSLRRFPVVERHSMMLQPQRPPSTSPPPPPPPPSPSPPFFPQSPPP